MKRNESFIRIEEEDLLMESSCNCWLDLTISSKLLSSKIADIPSKLKYETIIEPIFEYCFGTNHESIWEESKEVTRYRLNDSTPHETNEFARFSLKIDLKRDETFFKETIFDLPFYRLNILAKKLGLWKCKSFIQTTLTYHSYKDILFCVDETIRKDKETMLMAINANPKNLLLLGKKYSINNFEYVKRAVQQSVLALKFASTDLKNNKEIVKIALESDANALCFASDQLRSDREIVMLAIELNPLSLKCAAKELQNDFEIVKVAVMINGLSLQYASEELRGNRDIVWYAIEKNPESYEFASTLLKMDREIIFKAFSNSVEHLYQARHLRNDKEFLMMVTKIEGARALRYASDELRNDRQVVMQAIQQDANAIEYASADLKNDREIVKMAVRKDGISLIFLAKEFTADKEIVELAVKSNVNAISLVHLRLRADFSFISSLVGNRGFSTFIPLEFVCDKEIVLKSIKINPKLLGDVISYFIHDRDFMMQVMSQNGKALLYAPSYFDDEEIILRAAETDDISEYYPNISQRLISDRQFNLKLVTLNGKFFAYLPRKYKLDREFVMESLKTSPLTVFNNVSAKMLVSDRAFAIRIVKRDGNILARMSFDQRSDKEIVFHAVQQNKKSLKYASYELRNENLEL